MEHLTLPEPAATILARTHHILDRHVTPHTPGGDGWKIGGGTILAARWAHRQSEDIDLLVHPNTDTSHLEHRINPELSVRMREAGATHLDFETLPTIHFDNGRIEILARYPSPRRLPPLPRCPHAVLPALDMGGVRRGTLPTPPRLSLQLPGVGGPRRVPARWRQRERRRIRTWKSRIDQSAAYGRHCWNATSRRATATTECDASQWFRGLRRENPRIQGASVLCLSVGTRPIMDCMSSNAAAAAGDGGPAQ